MQLSLKIIGAANLHGEEPSPENIYAYEVVGLPDGHEAHIANRDFPRVLWSILHIRNGVPDDQPTGNYQSAEDALVMLRKEYD